MTNACLCSWYPTQALEKCRKTIALWQGRKNCRAIVSYSPKCKWENYWDKPIAYWWETLLRAKWEFAGYRFLPMPLWTSSETGSKQYKKCVKIKEIVFDSLVLLNMGCCASVIWDDSCHLQTCLGKGHSLFTSLAMLQHNGSLNACGCLEGGLCCLASRPHCCAIFLSLDAYTSALGKNQTRLETHFRQRPFAKYCILQRYSKLYGKKKKRDHLQILSLYRPYPPSDNKSDAHPES